MHKLFCTAALMSLLLVVSSCGKNSKQWVTDVNVETATQDDQAWVVTDFQLDLGKATLPFYMLPLPADYGNLRMWRLNGENYIGLDLNLTSILELPGEVATLPNGHQIPVGSNDLGIIEVEIDKINGKVYIAKAEGMTLVGVAVSIEQLDDLGAGDIGVYGNFNISGFDVTAGVYTSQEDGKNGIAIFANIGSLWDKAVYNSSVFSHRKEYVSKYKKRRIYRKLKRLLRKRMQLDVTQR
jgi:hypothetical protein